MDQFCWKPHNIQSTHCATRLIIGSSPTNVCVYGYKYVIQGLAAKLGVHVRRKLLRDILWP